MIFRLFFLLFLLLSKPLNAQTEPSTIVVTPQAYTKTVIRIPPLEGDIRDEITNAIRNLINLHLFCVALAEPPLPGLKSKEYYLKGKVETKEGKYQFLGELIDTFDGRLIRGYKIESSSVDKLAGTITDQIIKAVSPYQGVSVTRLTFVKRESTGDHLYIMDFSKKNLKKIRSSELILFPKFSPSGKKLAYLTFDGRDYYLEILTLATYDLKKIKIAGLSSAPLWLPNERELLLTLGREGEINIYLFSLEREELKAITSGRGVNQGGSVSPDGKWLAFVGDKSGKPQIYLLDLDTKKVNRISEGGYNTSPRFLARGDLIYLSQRGGKNELILYSPQRGEKKRFSLPYSLNDPAPSPTGDYLIFEGKGKTGKGLYLLHLDSLIVHHYLPFGSVHYPDWGRSN
ncbi:MAG: hypothetical protein N2Z40_00510 [Caldimicrobium sp.]|nr:hypothetical protein [Caldimicrobium sp.]MCX7612693.1 hypothetical protein [Caldimicrobium sp.]MDW8182447.1 hypothetical protein [Caldimicrobium sp.]